MNKSSVDGKITVICRLRPLNEHEKGLGGHIEGEDSKHDFTFDRIFGPETTQKEIFSIVAEPTIDSLMSGYNGTIFAYGQTASGKTFTMEGPSLDSEDNKGLIPRMMTSLFEHIVNADENIEFTVKVSFLEIYNEKINDLLDPRKGNLQIKEDKTRGIYVQDATEVYVNSPDLMRKAMATGASNRSIAFTKMNDRSSRSHSIFIVQLTQKNTFFDTMKCSKLFFVDLAGSEKIAKTNVTGKQLEEAKNINKSLSALGNVINALTSEKKEHVPYRDSKLTRILQESLGGNSKTTLIIAMSMCSWNDKETLSTLRFGNRAKAIKNKPIINVEKSAKELQILLDLAEKKIKQQEEIIEKLESELIELEKNPPQKLSATDQPRKSKISNMAILKLHIQISKLSDEVHKLTNEKNEMEIELMNRNQEVDELRDKLNGNKNYYKGLLSKCVGQMQLLGVKYEKSILNYQKFRNNFGNTFKSLNELKKGLNEFLIEKLMCSEMEDGGHEDLIYSINDLIQFIDSIEDFYNSEVSEQKNYIKIRRNSSYFYKNTLPETKSNEKQRKKHMSIDNINLTTNSENVSPLIKNANLSINDELNKLEEKKIQEINEEDLVDKNKLKELQQIIISQRYTIENLNKKNEELGFIIDKNQNVVNLRVKKYKKQILELNNLTNYKTIEFKEKIETLEKILNKKDKEIEQLQLKMSFQEKKKQEDIENLNKKHENYEKIINSDDLAKQILEMEDLLQKEKIEKENIIKLNTILQEKNEDLTLNNLDKDEQIRNLQMNINLLLNRVDVLSRNKEFGSPQPVNLKKSPLDLKSSKHVVQPIKGGGGNLFNYRQNNYIFTTQEDEEDSISQLKINSDSSPNRSVVYKDHTETKKKHENSSFVESQMSLDASQQEKSLNRTFFGTIKNFFF